MTESQQLSRRSAFAGLGAASVGLFIGAHTVAAQTLPNRETGGAPAGDGLAGAADRAKEAALLGHRLNGRWLSMIGLPSDPKTTIAVPSFFGSDGTAVLCFPGTEAAEHGIQIKGPFMGTWDVIDDRKGRVTAVQVLSDMAGRYLGTATLDATFTIDDDGESFALEEPLEIFTIRDHRNTITGYLSAPAENPMRGFRMSAGNPGFPQAAPYPERRTPD